MAAAVEAKYALGLEVTETLALAMDNVPGGDPSFVHSMGADEASLNASSTPAVTEVFSDNVALAAGTLTLDLQNLVGPAGTTVDFTGLKVQLVKLKCPSSNTLPILVQKGAANAYNMLGADNASAETIEVMPGAIVLFYHNDKLEDVDATHSDVLFTGNGTETINVMLVAG